MNLPNKLTLARLVLTVLFLGVIFLEVPGWATWGLVLFVAASLTDYFDGKIARRDHLITNFGVLLDPLADKILTCSAFIAFVGLGEIAAWMVVIIVSRELAITGLRLLAASKHITLSAEKYGKHKTISQMVAIIAILTTLSYPSWGNWAILVFDAWAPAFTVLSKWVAVFLTSTSGIIYLWKNRTLYLEDR